MPWIQLDHSSFLFVVTLKAKMELTFGKKRKRQTQTLLALHEDVCTPHALSRMRLPTKMSPN